MNELQRLKSAISIQKAHVFMMVYSAGRFTEQETAREVDILRKLRDRRKALENSHASTQDQRATLEGVGEQS